MGYSHGWCRPNELEREKFAAAVDDCRKVCEASMIPLRGIEGAVEPVFREFIVAFNGGCGPSTSAALRGNRAGREEKRSPNSLFSR